MTDPIIRRSTFTELADWNDHVDRLAERAERAAAAPAAALSLAERASLATEAVQLLWLALSPAVIAASCRATSLLGEPVLIGFLPLDQQLLAAHALRDAGVLDQQALGQREPVVEPAEVEPEAACEKLDETASWTSSSLILPKIGSSHLNEIGDDDHQCEELQEEAPVVDVGEPVVEEQEELEEVDHQGDELQEQQEQELLREIEEQPAAAEWVGSPELSALMGVSAGTVRSWSGKGWFVLGDHFIQDPNDRRRYLFNVERCRVTASERSKKLKGREARTPAGIEERRLLRVQRQNLRRQAKRNAEQVGAAAEPERLTEPVGREPEQAGGGRLEQLIEALLAEVRGSGS